MSTPPLFESPEDLDSNAGASEPEQSPRAGRQRFKTGERHQREFCELTLDERVRHDHPVRAIDDWVAAQNLTELLKRYQAFEGSAGRSPIHPRILLKLWIFATLEGVGSARELSQLIERDDLYRWLAEGISICHRVLSEFRVLDGDFMERLLVAHVSDLMKAGLVTMHTVAQDGMRVRASAGKSSFRRKNTLEALEEKVQEQLQVLREELENPAKTSQESRQAARRLQHKAEQLKRIKEAQEERNKLEAQRARRSTKEPEARASTTDPEARTMKMANGGFNPAYNVQYGTDKDSGIIVSVGITNQGTDAGQTGPALEMMSRSYGQGPQNMLADGGYATREDIDSCRAMEATPYMPIKELQKKLEKGLDPYAPQPGDSPAVEEWRQRMSTEEAKEIYQFRCQTAERVNAQTRNHGFQQMPVRGLKKARCIALLHALTHNIQRATVLQNPKREVKAR